MHISGRDNIKRRDLLIESLESRLEESLQHYEVRTSPLIGPQLEKALQEVCRRFDPKGINGEKKDWQDKLDMILAFGHAAPALLIKKFQIPLSLPTVNLFFHRAKQLNRNDLLFALLYVVYMDVSPICNPEYFCTRFLSSAQLEVRHTETDYQEIATGLMCQKFTKQELQAHPVVWLINTVNYLHANRTKDYPLKKTDSRFLLSLMFPTSSVD